MANTSHVDVVISPDGSGINVDGKNFTGGACKTVIDALTANLGSVEQSGKKPEFHEVEQQHTTVTQ